MKVNYSPTGVCAKIIQFDIDEEKKIINEVKFFGGCAGNALGIGSLVKGMPIAEAIKKLEGIDCNGKGTSCPDQLAKALHQYNCSV